MNIVQLPRACKQQKLSIITRSKRTLFQRQALRHSDMQNTPVLSRSDESEFRGFNDELEN